METSSARSTPDRGEAASQEEQDERFEDRSSDRHPPWYLGAVRDVTDRLRGERPLVDHLLRHVGSDLSGSGTTEELSEGCYMGPGSPERETAVGGVGVTADPCVPSHWSRYLAAAILRSIQPTSACIPSASNQ